MIIIHLSGGFGNQLFSYAFAYALSKRWNIPLAIDTAIQDAPWFFRNPDIMKMNITYDKRITYKIGRSIPERAILNRLRFRQAIGFYTPQINEYTLRETMHFTKLPGYFREHGPTPGKNVYYKGNWILEDYFKEYREDILSRFTFKDSLSPGAEAIRAEIEGNPSSVTLHYRTGDYYRIGAIPTAEYFTEAMKLMSEKLASPVFYCFTEDYSYVKNQLRDLDFDIRYPEYESPDKGIEDFRLLMAGHGCITSNSTYSWWSSYLSNACPENIIFPYNKSWTIEMGADGWTGIPFKTISQKN